VDEEGWTPFLYAVHQSEVACAMKLLQRREILHDKWFDDNDNQHVYAPYKTYTSSSSSSSSTTVNNRNLCSSSNTTRTASPARGKQALIDIYDFNEAVLQLKVSTRSGTTMVM
jgi:hypothetical protein